MIKKLIVTILSVFLLIIPTSCMYDLAGENQNGNGENNPNLPSVNLDYFTGSFSSMHTFVSLNLFTENSIKANSVQSGIKKIFDTYNNVSDPQLSKFVNEYTGQIFDKKIIEENILKENTKELAKLNYYRHLDNASDELVELLSYANQMKNETNGYFNPYLGFLNVRWKTVIEGFSNPNLVSLGESIYYSEIARNAEIIIEGNSITLGTKKNKNDSAYQDYLNGYLVDLGGIAKGYATEKANDYIIKSGHKYYLLNAGASNIVTGKFNNKNNDNWEISISYPFGYKQDNPTITIKDGYYYVDDKKSTAKVVNDSKVYYGVGNLNMDFVNKNKMKINDVYFDTTSTNFFKILSIDKLKTQSIGSLPATYFNIKDQAVVTSSPQQQHVYIDGEMYHHLLNPFTGRPVDIDEAGKDSVTIVGGHSGMLDAYSTALFSMNLDEAKKFVKDKNLEVYFIVNNEVIHLKGSEL